VEGRSGLFEGDECLKIVRTHQKHRKRHRTAVSSHTEQCREGRYSCGDDGVELPPSARAQQEALRKEREEKKVGMERAVEGDISRMETHTHTPPHPPTPMEGMGEAGGGAGHCIVEETVGMQLEQATSWSKAHGKQREWWTATTVPPRPHDTFATAMRPPP